MTGTLNGFQIAGACARVRIVPPAHGSSPRGIWATRGMGAYVGASASNQLAKFTDVTGGRRVFQKGSELDT